MISLFRKSPYRLTYRAENTKKIPRVANTSLGKIFRLVLVEVHQGLKENYERYRFSGKAPPGRYIVLRTRKKNPRAANTSLGKIFRLVLVETVHQGLKKNYERYGFSVKAPLGRYIVLRTRKKNPRVANTTLGKIFRLIRVEKVTQGLKRNYERNRFSGKAPRGRYIGLRTPKKFPESQILR